MFALQTDHARPIIETKHRYQLQDLQISLEQITQFFPLAIVTSVADMSRVQNLVSSVHPFGHDFHVKSVIIS